MTATPTLGRIDRKSNDTESVGRCGAFPAPPGPRRQEADFMLRVLHVTVRSRASHRWLSARSSVTWADRVIFKSPTAERFREHTNTSPND